MKNMLTALGGLLVVIVSITAGAALAQTAQEVPDDARAFIQELADNTLEVLDNIYMTQEERDQEFHRLLREGFEIEYLAKLVLGHHRRTASKEQMERFNEVFPDYIIAIYANRLQEYGDERFTVTGVLPVGKKDIYIQSEVTRKGRDPFQADWRLRMMDGELRIIDIKISGISMLQTQRDEFSSRINAVGMDGLIDDMREKTGNEATDVAQRDG